ncbi:MAG: glycoside hydrolase family 3 domain protein [Gemmatimonadetes bacterium]|nr:glycoside hydrolase family 3 domain protein [Gemmatimonadota bacterium]
MTVTRILIGALALSQLSLPARAQTPGAPQQTPAQIAARNEEQARIRAASEADRKAMLDLLGIKDPPPPATTGDKDPNRRPELVQRPNAPTNNWYDAAGNTYVRSQWGNWNNYDESRAGPTVATPDPLVMKNGTRVTSAAQWWSKRRPEILNDFLTEIYGKTPAFTPAVKWEVVSTDSTTFAGKAIVKKIVGHVDNARYPAAKPSVDITLYLPARRSGRVPVIVGGGGFGAPGQLPATVQQVLDMGWASASVNTNNVQADNGAGLKESIIGLMSDGKPRKPDDWGVLAAWSWGYSRALDYLSADPAIDGTKAAIHGHSRGGKAALLAGALDQRWAIVWPSCSGAMGSSLEKRGWGETIDNVAGSSEYHWMAGNFLKYAGHWDAMPTDAHELIALVAPRPVFNTGGTDDQWSDPHGEFLASVGADPVYTLLGARGLGTTTMPALDVALIDGENAFRNHTGGHTDAPDWPTFLQFAKRHFDQPRVAYLDETKSFEERTADLVARMTLEEKVSQMKDVAPAIERLGVPVYNWWNEGLHGVARAQLATVFPQAIGFAATWDDNLVFRMANVISDEFRAKHHDYLQQGLHQRYQGLTIWSPNINIFRDPRWGRGQETYGEDPFLTGRIAVPFIKGLQGDDPKYFKTIATVKHFAVHSGPEPDRHGFDAVVSERDLRETYLPQFETGIREGGAYSLMCAYNRIDGKAACAQDMLEQNILRGEWKFPGYIVSDCGAIDDIYLRHKVAPTAAAAAALAVKTGTDLDCGRVYPNLVDAVAQGLITESEIDVSVKRLFLARMKLGMFDASEHVKWAQIPKSVLDQPSHRELARQVARESMVLLKNAKNTLPLKKSAGTIAVIGPNADQARMLLGNYNGEPADPITPLRGIREAVGASSKVVYARGSDLAENFPVLDLAPASVFVTPDGTPGLRVDFFNGQSAAGTPLFSRVDSTLNVAWEEAAPRVDMNAEDFSVRWSGAFHAPQTGTYRLGLIGTMKFQLYLNDSLIFRSRYPTHDGEYPDPRLVQSTPLQLEAGKDYKIRVESQETYGDAQLQMIMSTPHETLEAEAVRVAQSADVVVMVLGLTARLEGEEMPVLIDGFKGGDRTKIDLPAPQEKLLESIAKLGKPTVLVLLNGSALAVNWAQDNVPAIVEGWYPGQAGGSALADVLFGDYNPAGRLPVTFYRDTTDLPAFANYDMKGRTYRYFKGTPLYPFGHGLSYTTFGYSNLKTSAPTLTSNGSVTVKVDVKNTGRRAGDEVVQMYVKHIGSKVERSNRELRGYKRVSLKPGETKTVSFALPASAVAYWNADTHAWTVEDDTVQIDVGASSADLRVNKKIKVTSKK